MASAVQGMTEHRNMEADCSAVSTQPPTQDSPHAALVCFALPPLEPRGKTVKYLKILKEGRGRIHNFSPWGKMRFGLCWESGRQRKK